MTRAEERINAVEGTLASERLSEIASSFAAAAASEFPDHVERLATLLGDTFAAGGKLLVFGNGGSASDAQHLAGELVVRFQKNRQAFPVIALGTDAAVMTACGNDFCFEDVFRRQVEALGRAEDLALGISTSGTSKNVLRGLAAAREKGMRTVLLTGPRTLEPAHAVDLLVRAPGGNTARIQELHLAAYHIISELIEERFCPSGESR